MSSLQKMWKLANYERIFRYYIINEENKDSYIQKAHYS